MIYKLTNSAKASAIFEGWQETMIDSCLQDVMGHIYVTDSENPRSACASVGCFAFYAGETDKELVQNKPGGFVIMVPGGRTLSEWGCSKLEFCPIGRKAWI